MNFVNQYKLGKNNDFTKRTNRATVLRMLRANNSLTRAELVKLTSLTPQSVSKIMVGLEKSGLIESQEKIFGGKGQPPLPYTIRPDVAFGIGIQLERNSLEASLLNFGGQELASTNALHSEHTSEGLYDLLHTAVKRLLEISDVPKDRIWGIGLAAPRLSNNLFEERHAIEDPFWSNFATFELENRLSKDLALPIFSENDANAGALGENIFGGAQTIKNFCYIHLSEGLGCGIISDGRMFRGAGGNAGEIGRIQLSPNDADSVVENYLNIHTLQNEASIDKLAKTLRWLVSIMENMYDPSTIIVGGDIETQKLETLLAATYPLLPTIASRSDKRNPRLLVSKLGKKAVSWGSAMIPILGTISASPSSEWKYYGKIFDVYPY